jgi:ribulose 1,5-bisphosphate synthetase/thiazole synthase
MDSVENIRAKIPLNVIIIGAGIGGLAAATVSIEKNYVFRSSYDKKIQIGM